MTRAIHESRAVFRRMPLPLLAATIVACAGAGKSLDPGGVPGDGALRTDSISYVATSLGDGNYSVRLVVRYRNTASATIYLDRCFPASPSPIYFISQVLSQDPSGSAWSPSWACVGHKNPIVVAPGASRVDTIELRAPNSVDHYTQKPFGAFEGWLRLTFEPRNCVSETSCAILDDSLRTTNAFRISLPK